MKKKLFIIFAVIFCITLTGCSSELPEENDSGNNTEATEQTKVSPVKVYEDSKVKVTFTGYDYDEPALLFEVENKSKQNISFSCESILVNGKTENPVYSADILAGSKNTATCDVSTADIKTLTAEMEIYDSDGYEIEKFSVKDIKLQ